MLSQALSSAGNFTVSLLGARAGTAAEFGRVAVALAVYLIVISAGRALICDPLVIRHQRDRGELSRRTALTAGLYLGVAAGIVLLAIELARAPSGLRFGQPMLALAAALPLLIWFDVQRYQWFAVGMPGRSAALDGIWLVFLIAGTLVQSNASPSDVWTTWCATGAMTGLIAVLWSRGPTGARSALRWLRTHADLGRPLLVETAATGVSANLALVLFAIVSDASDVGTVRAATTLFGPLTVLYLGIYPSLLRHAQTSRDAMVRLARTATTAMTVIALLWATVLVMLPTRAGERLLGETWEPVHDILWVTGLAVVASVASTGAILGLRALAAARASMRVRLVTGLPNLLVPVILGAAFGAIGFAAAALAVTTATTGLLWRAFYRTLPADDWRTVTEPA